VGVVDGAAHTQKDYVESNRGSLENVAKVFVLFLCGVQLALRSGVLTVLDLDSRWMSRQVLLRSLGRCCLGLVAVLVAGGVAGVLPVSLAQLPPATSKNPRPCVSLLFLCFCSDGSDQHKIWAAGGKSVFIWEACLPGSCLSLLVFDLCRPLKEA
jgi:hypothetical protein